MLGKLKGKMSDNVADKAIEKLMPMIQEKIGKIQTLSAADVSDDANFKSRVIAPSLIAVSAASSGATKLLPDFENRFSAAMFHLRNELVTIDGDTVALVDDYQKRLPTVLKEGLKKQS